jgi:hypothetical protein
VAKKDGKTANGNICKIILIKLELPRLLVDDKSVGFLASNYYTQEKQVETAPKLSKYYGTDYHFVLKDN